MLRTLIASCAAITSALAVAAVEPLDPALGDWSAAGAPTVQVIPMGGGRYIAPVLTAFANGEAPLAVLQGTGKDGTITFTGASDGWQEETDKETPWWPAPKGSSEWKATLAGGVLTLQQPGKPVQQLAMVEHPSPTLGAKPPAGAIVLLGSDIKDQTALDQEWGSFKGTKADGPCPWALEDGGVLRCVPGKKDVATKRVFGDCSYHAEFNLAFEPANKRQNRSNSGIFIQERYETQVLDSYGHLGAFNETGSLYREEAKNNKPNPLVNACLAPGRWQTYDVDFTAARCEGTKVISPAIVTIRLNGILVQDGTTLDSATGARKKSYKITNDKRPFLLQDHSHPVAFRNFWVVEKK